MIKPGERHRGQIRLSLHIADGALEIIRQPFIVSVEKRQILSPRFGDGSIACGAGSGILLAEEADASIAEILHQRGAGIGGSVVHHDYFQIAKGLRRRRSKGCFHRPLFIEQWDDG